MHQVRFGGMHDRHRFADNQLNNSSDEEATDDEELRTDPCGKHRNRLAKTARNRAAEPHHKLVPDVVLDRRKRLVSETIIPNSRTRGQQTASDIADVVGAGAAGSQAEAAGMCTVGSSANIDGQRRGSKRKASGHSSGFCIRRKRRTGCGVQMLILAPSLCSTYYPEHLMLRRCAVHAASPLPG